MAEANEPTVDPVAPPAAPPDPTAEPAPSAPDTIASSVPAEDVPPVAVQATWPDDWRQKMAGKDDAFLKRLGRFASPENLVKSYRDLEKKLSEGAKQVPFPAEGSDEEKAAWRAANSLPDKPEAYLENLDGLVIGDADKETVGAFAKDAFERGERPETVKATLKWYYNVVAEQQERQAETDAQFRAESDMQLRQQWGNDYRGNLQAINSLLDTGPKGIKDMLFSARLADGTPLGNHPDVLNFLAQMAHEVNPASTVVPASGAGGMKGIADEIASIETRMRDDRAGYFKDEAMQKRYAQLIEARQKMAARAA